MISYSYKTDDTSSIAYIDPFSISYFEVRIEYPSHYIVTILFTSGIEKVLRGEEAYSFVQSASKYFKERDM